jgi:hypothetical protein
MSHVAGIDVERFPAKGEPLIHVDAMVSVTNSPVYFTQVKLVFPYCINQIIYYF